MILVYPLCDLESMYY